MHPGAEYPELNPKGILTYSKPGIEWSHDKKSGTRLWNNREHGRKFMRMNGVKYLDAKKDPIKVKSLSGENGRHNPVLM